MIFQIVIGVALITLAIYAASQRRRSPIVAIAIFLSAVMGIALVAIPELATKCAHYVGVGRGADLIVYVFIVIALTAVFNLHLRLRSHAEVATQLARAIALERIRQPPPAAVKQLDID